MSGPNSACKVTADSSSTDTAQADSASTDKAQADASSTDTAQAASLSALQPKVLPALREYPSRLFVETTTRCNLKCRMCVKQTEGNCIAEGDLSPEVFAALEPALPHAEALVLNGIGEPLLHRGLERLVFSTWESIT